MQIITLDKIVYACSFSPHLIDKTEKKTHWLGQVTDSLQGSLMCYDKKDFAIHKHKLNPRLINYSQEAFIVVQGKVQIDIYEDFIDENNQKRWGYTVKKDEYNNEYIYLGSLIAKEKEIILVWKGYHAVKFIEDNTLAYELKAGSFNGIIAEDKKIINFKKEEIG